MDATPSTPSPPSTLKDRVRWLLNGRALSVNACALATGIPQRTLARIVSGDSPAPRTDAIARLAKFFNVTERWILTGEGQINASMRQLEEAVNAARGGPLEWRQAVKSLGLPPAVERAVIELPEAGARAMQAMLEELDAEKQGRADVRDLVIHAHHEECGAWNLWLVRALGRFGPEAVREWLIRHHKDVRGRFAKLERRRTLGLPGTGLGDMLS